VETPAAARIEQREARNLQARPHLVSKALAKLGAAPIDLSAALCS
jgi:hypothetical protein